MQKRIGEWNPARGVWEAETADLLSERSEPFSGTWPTSGTTRGGVAFALPMPELPMVASASSSSPGLPTPRASRGASGTETMYSLGAARTDNHRTQGQVVMLPTPQAHDSVDGKTAEQVKSMRQRTGAGVWNLNEVAANELSLLPTPKTSDHTGPGIHGTGGQDLRTEISLLKTPTSQLAVNGGSQHPEKRKAGGHGPTLADEVEHLLPTPSAHEPGFTKAAVTKAGEVPTHGSQRWYDPETGRVMQKGVSQVVRLLGGLTAQPSSGGYESLDAKPRRPRKGTEKADSSDSPPNSSNG